jgi:hypothetical protein
LFEAWAVDSKQGYDLTREDGAFLATYKDTRTEHAWRGYCAAALSAPAQPASVGVTAAQRDTLIDAELEARGYPSNSRNAARAGWYAHAKAMAAQPASGVAAVGVVRAGTYASGMPWCEVEWLSGDNPPAGTELFTAPPASQEQAKWCEYVAGMIWQWLHDSGAIRWEEDRCAKAMAGIIERRLWALKREASQEQAQQSFADVADINAAMVIREQAQPHDMAAMLGRGAKAWAGVDAQQLRADGQAQPTKPMFAASVAARKWAELQEQGHRMQSIAFDGGTGGPGTIDPWGKVMWAQPSTSGWLTPTTYVHRFTNSVRLLCGKEPPADMVASWLDKEADDHRLQEFAIEHGPAWCQGIGLLDAAHVMADQPTEGVDHEPATETLRDVLQERFDLLHMSMPSDPREALTALVNAETMIALDPAVSEQAEALVQRGRDEAQPSGKVVACGMRHNPVWNDGVSGYPYQSSNFACGVCGYIGTHDTHPGCRRADTAPQPAQPAARAALTEAERTDMACVVAQPSTCAAVQHSDQMVCDRCKAAWDVNDPEPPECLPASADAETRHE